MLSLSESVPSLRPIEALSVPPMVPAVSEFPPVVDPHAAPPKRVRRKVQVLEGRRSQPSTTTGTGAARGTTGAGTGGRGPRSDSWQKNQDPEAVRYFTPPWLLQEVYTLFEPETGRSDGVDLDPCMDPEAFVSASVGYDIRRGDDGLGLPWDLAIPRTGFPEISAVPRPPQGAPVAELLAYSRYVEAVIKEELHPEVRRTAYCGEAGTRIATVFCNPPYDKPTPWLAKGAAHYAAGGSAVFLVNAAPGTRAWREHVFGCPGALVCFMSRRIAFYKRGVGYEGPNNRDSAIIYFGPRHERFYERFSPLGTIIAPWSPAYTGAGSSTSSPPYPSRDLTLTLTLPVSDKEGE